MDASVLGDLVTHFGLPLVMLAAVAWAFVTRKVITIEELNRAKVDWDEREKAYIDALNYRETLRADERRDREAAEERLDRFLEVDSARNDLLRKLAGRRLDDAP